MFEFGNSPFGQAVITIPPTAKVVFVADFFVNDYVGGAELTSQALIDSCDHEVFTLHSKNVTMELLKQGTDRFWIFGNFTQLNSNLIPSIVGNLKYSVLEYDFKYCRFRSPEKHLNDTGIPCDCQNQMNGKLVSAFYHGASGLWWMSEKQKEKYVQNFPFLDNNDNWVLSSVFDPSTLGYIQSLKERYKDIEKTKWIVLGSNSWVKGFENAKEWCEKNGYEYEVVWNIPYNDLLEKLAQAKGHVYLPNGSDTCPRLVIEAKLLGCELKLNDHVLHKDEEWFTGDNETLQSYLYAAPDLFWKVTNEHMNHSASISGYVTTYNCIEQEYPFEQCIRSLLPFCEEVCIVDGGSTDGTLDVLEKLSEEDDRVKFKVVRRDWSHPRFAVFDGEQKAEARSMCTKEFCWQMDSDEIVHELDVDKIKNLASKLPKDVNVLALPVVEYWGSEDKVRCDVTPWKWRLSRNISNVTHGIPKELRTQDSDGNLCALQGTDGCDLIDKDSYERIPFIGFYTNEIDQLRKFALVGSNEALQRYQAWFEAVVEQLPGVFHYSWYDLPRKIRLYKKYWTRHWLSLYNESMDDTAENNMMFDLPWSHVTDEMIDVRSKELKNIGGWIWHRKWDGTKTPHITITKDQPKLMKQFTK